MGPKFIFLISPVLTSDFEIHDLQVRVLAKSIFFSGLVFGFAHLGTICEPARASTSYVDLFVGKGATGSLVLPI